jgi:hypothetical protein
MEFCIRGTVAVQNSVSPVLGGRDIDGNNSAVLLDHGKYNHSKTALFSTDFLPFLFICIRSFLASEICLFYFSLLFHSTSI